VLLLSGFARTQGHTSLKIGKIGTLSDPDKKKVIDTVKQEYLVYLFLNNSNAKLHSQLKKDVAK
jgi:hypothetical protein